MGNPTDTTLEAACRALQDGAGKSLAWSWDGRLGAALATFPGERADEVRALVRDLLGPGWDHASLPTAPPAVTALAARIGGVRPGQWITASDTSGPTAAVAVWWPWSGGQTISIRVFPVETHASVPAGEAFVAAFRGWFGA